MPLPDASVDIILDAISEYDYEYFGLRREDYLPADGSILPNSIDHDTDEELNGTSTFEVKANRASIEKALRRAEVIGGDVLVLVGANVEHGGEDPGEALLMNPIVLIRMSAKKIPWHPGRAKR